MKKTLMMIAGFGVTCTPLLAQTVISETKAFGPDVLSFNDILNFDQYDGDLADILSVEWCYSLTVDGGQLIMDNDSSSPAHVDAMFGADLSVTSTDVNLLDPSFNPLFSDVQSATTGSFDLAANVGDGIGDYDPTGPDGATLAGQLVTSTGSGSVNSAFWSQYLGTGSIALDIQADTLSSIGSVGGVEIASTPGTANGTITLKVTVVPEPSSSVLLLGGLLGLVTRRRR